MTERKMSFSFVGKDVSASKTMDTVGKSAHGLGHSLLGVGKIAAGVFGGNLLSSAADKAVSFAKNSVGAFNTTAAAAIAMQKTTGGSVRAASEWVAIGQKFGLSSSQVTLATKTLEKQSVSGSKAWAAYNIKAGSTSSMLKQVANQFAKMPDGPKKAAEAQTLFGRSGITMIPILDKGAKGLAQLRAQADKTGVAIGAKGVASYKKFRDAHRDLSEAIEGVKVKLGAALEPAMTSMIKTFQRALPGIQTLAHTVFPMLGKAASQVSAVLGPKLGVALSAIEKLFQQGIVPVVSTVVGIFKNDLLPIIEGVAGFVLTKLVPAIETLYQSALKDLKGALQVVAKAIAAHRAQFAQLFTAIKKVAGFILTILVPVLKVTLLVAFKIIGKALAILIAVIGDLISVIGFLVKHASGAFHDIVSVVSSAVGEIKKHIAIVATVLAGPFGLAVVEIIKHWGKVKSFFKAIPGEIKGFFKGAYTLLAGVGKRIADGLANAFVSEITGPATKLMHGAMSLIHKIHASPSFEEMAPKLLVKTGQLLAQGMASGFSAGLKAAVTKMHAALTNVGAAMSSAQAAATAKLQSARSNAASIASGISGNFSASNSFDSTTGKFAGAASFAAAQQKAASQVKRESALVKKALRAGLNMTDINQILQLAPAQADAALSSILGTAGSVRSLNSSAHEMNKYAKATGNAVAGTAAALEESKHQSKLLEHILKAVSQDHLSAAIAMLLANGQSAGMSPAEIRALDRKLKKLQRTLGHPKAA